MKKFLTVLLSLSLAWGLTACAAPAQAPETEAAPQEAPAEQETETAETAAKTVHTIGVLNYSRTEEEALAFQDYLDNYIAGCFNVKFLYSDTVSDTEEAKAFIELAAENGVEGIMSFNFYDLEAEVNLCAEKNMYYMMASASISDEDFNKVAENPYFLGVVGPGSEVEYQAGVDMAQFFMDQKYGDEYFIISGLGMWGNEMHLQRTMGTLDALQAAYDVILPVDSREAAASAEITHMEAGGLKVCVVPGYMAIEDQLAVAVEEYTKDQYPVVMSVLAGSQIRDTIAGAHVGIIDSFTEANSLAVNNGELEYVAGKYRSIIGPSFAAMYNAVTGHADKFREADGKAFHVTQGFWTATGAEDFQEKYILGSSLQLNAYNFEDLYNVCTVYNEGATLDDLKSLAAACGYTEVLARRAQ